MAKRWVDEWSTKTSILATPHLVAYSYGSGQTRLLSLEQVFIHADGSNDQAIPSNWVSHPTPPSCSRQARTISCASSSGLNQVSAYIRFETMSAAPTEPQFVALTPSTPRKSLILNWSGPH